MEVGKHNRNASQRDTLRKEKRKVPYESGFLRFTFVPSFGKLPAQFHVADTPAFLVGGEGEPVDKHYQENARNRSTAVGEDQALGRGKEGKGDASRSTKSYHSLLHRKEPDTSRQKMDREDLFKAEFVFLLDSEEDTKTALDNGYRAERSSTLETSCVSARGESRRQENAPLLSLHPEPPYSPTGQHEQPQLTSPLSTSGHPFHTPPVAHFLSPTNLKVDHEVAPPAFSVSSLQESHSQWQSANGSSIHRSSTYFHSTTSSDMPSSILKRPSLPLPCSLSDHAQPTSSLKAHTPPKESEAATATSKGSNPSPQLLSSAQALQSPSPRAHSPLPSKTLTTWSVVPIAITAHVLSPSPRPLSSPSHGSSSTLCSANNPSSQMSSSGNLQVPRGKSSLPTRLSLLTAILKSGSSPKRPFSPASCPASFSPNSLGSSMLTLDQKVKGTPPTPKKATSSISVRSTSPSRDECHLSVFSGFPNHTSWSSKSSPRLRSRSLSPKSHLDPRAVSPDKLRPLSPTISSYRKTVVSPLLQPKRPDLSSPPSALRKGALSPPHRARGPEHLKKVHTHSPTFTAKSIPIPVSASPTCPRDLSSSVSTKGCRSPTRLYSSSLSPGPSPQASAKDPRTTSPTWSPSARWPFSQTDATIPPRPGCHPKPSSAQTNSSSLHSNFRACPPPSRPRTSAGTQRGSPTGAHAPYSPLSRSRELNSPLSFSLPSDSDNKIPKIKTSYKAFAAIPTNTLLLEQKALDEPTRPEAVEEDKALDTHSEMCSPAQLRQQTEELCAAIDQVLQQDPLAKHQRNSPPTYLQNLCDSDVGKASTALQRASGRETRYANLCLSGPPAPESPKTKPGVIRPTLVKAKIIIKEEEPIQPNPFKKYLEETSDAETEDSPLALLFPPTKLKPSTKSILHPPSVSYADSLTPGSFNHLGSTFGDIYDYSYTPYQRNALYHKPPHPIVPIPENEALSSKEIMLCSARVKDKQRRPPYQDKKDLSKGNFPDPVTPPQHISLSTQRRPWE